MNERMITIPFEEYEELQNFKRMAQEEYMKIYLKTERYDFGSCHKWWEIYTKDEAVRKITDELIETRRELENIKDAQENKKEQISTGRIVLNLILTCVAAVLVFAIFKSLYQ